MDSIALALVVCSALAHASWNLLAKKVAGGAPFVWLYGVVSLLPALPLGGLAWWAFDRPLPWQAWLAVLASAVLHVLYSLVLQRGYRASDFSVVYPLARGTGPLLAVLGAMVFLHEWPSGLGWCGIAAIVLGILLLADGPRLLHSGGQTLRAGLRWGLLTGGFIAAYTVVDGWAIKALGLPPVLYYGLGLVLRTALLAPQALRDVPALRAQWASHRAAIVWVGLLSPLAYTLTLLALQRAPLMYVAPIREVSMLVAVLLGASLLREAITPVRALGVLCMLLGVSTLALAG
jgi:drug/metabolite transporter (DMT)-like permease